MPCTSKKKSPNECKKKKSMCIRVQTWLEKRRRAKVHIFASLLCYLSQSLMRRHQYRNLPMSPWERIFTLSILKKFFFLFIFWFFFSLKVLTTTTSLHFNIYLLYKLLHRSTHSTKWINCICTKLIIITRYYDTGILFSLLTPPIHALVCTIVKGINEISFLLKDEILSKRKKKRRRFSLD